VPLAAEEFRITPPQIHATCIYCASQHGSFQGAERIYFPRRTNEVQCAWCPELEAHHIKEDEIGPNAA
jgi:hypothetical protein